MSIPTVAEVRDLVMAMRNTAGDGQVWLLGPIDALLDRLDPDTQVIVDRDSLAAALHTFICSGAWCSCEADSDALMDALRGGAK